MRKREKLRFNNFTFKEGVNITVRRGNKWYNYGTGPVILYDNQTGETEMGFIHTVTNVPFKAVKHIELQNEHDPQCRTYKKLLKVMQETYDDFQEGEYVTVVRFKVT